MVSSCVGGGPKILDRILHIERGFHSFVLISNLVMASSLLFCIKRQTMVVLPLLGMTLGKGQPPCVFSFLRPYMTLIQRNYKGRNMGQGRMRFGFGILGEE